MEVSRKRAESPISPKIGGKIPKLDTNMATENIKNTLVDVGQQFDRWCELMVIIGAITHEAFALDLLNWFERCPKLSAARRKKGILPVEKKEESDNTHNSGDGISCDKSANQSAASQNSSRPEPRSEESYKITLNDSCSSSPVPSSLSPFTSQDATIKETDEKQSKETEKCETGTSQGTFPVMVMAVPGADEAITADPSTTLQYTNQSTPNTESSKPKTDSPNQAENKVFGPRHVIEAVKMVCSGNMSVEDASIAYKVPRRTLEKKVNRYKAFQACISTSDDTVINKDGKPQTSALDTGDKHEAFVAENSQVSVETEENDSPSATSRSSSPQVWVELSKSYRSYNSDILPGVAMSVAEGQIRLMEACKQYNIPKSTLQARIKQYKMKRSSADEYSTNENVDDTNHEAWSLQQVFPSDEDVVNPSSMIASCNAEQLRQVIQALDEENEENCDAKLSNCGASENPTIQALLEGGSSNEESKSHRYYKVYNTAIVPSLVENVVEGKMSYSEVVNDYGIPRRTLQAKVKALKEQKFKEQVVNEMKKDICEDPNIISNNSSIQILNVQSGTDPIAMESDEMVLQKEYTDAHGPSSKGFFQCDVENDSSSATSESGNNICVDMADLRHQQELMKIPGLTGTEPIKKVMKLVEQGKVTMQQAARHFSIPRFILPKPNADGTPVVLDVSSPPVDDKPKNKFISSLLAQKLKMEEPNSSDKWIVPKRPICRGSYKTYDTKLLPQILDLVIQGHLSQLEAHRQFNIPKSTLQFKLKQMKSRMKTASNDSVNVDDSSSPEGPIATVSTDSSMDENRTGFIESNENQTGFIESNENQTGFIESNENTEEIDDTEEYMGGDADPRDEDWKPPRTSACKVEYVWDGKHQEEEDVTDMPQDIEFETLRDSLDDDPNLLHIDSDGAGPSTGELSPNAIRTFRGNYKHYSAEILMEILQSVDQRRITQQQACNQYGIPKSTLQCKLKAYRETGSLQVSPRSRYAPQKRGHYKTYDSSQLPKIAKLVKNGKLKLKQACNLYNIPMSTLQQKIKKLESESVDLIDVTVSE
ncbi:uncharacterized protein LOC121367611 isoform X1 [Gigantopelta aegis]|uniref:uncharacterized protein LOC121367611 isoform X1 n=1 Tax=Gigantopelta aegis TaxID=1735272 RepID=UPI001B88C5DB|nr:uncharacterized protein LOC121367611 isoform X1 [Gigantopelta aegis]